jgi:FtsH-binding integral membrane protein
MISIIRYLGCIIIMLVMFWLQRKMKNPMAALIICIFVFLMPLLLYSSGISIMKYVGITPFLLGNL